MESSIEKRINELTKELIVLQIRHGTYIFKESLKKMKERDCEALFLPKYNLTND